MKRLSLRPVATRSLVRLIAAVAATTLLPGCGSAPSGPQLDPAGFPRAIQSLHNLAGEVIDAFASGNPADADRPLHNVGKTIGSIKRLAPVAGLSTEQQASVDEALEEVIAAFSTLHDPMHEDEVPADFDYKPAADALRAGLDNLRAALPEAIAAEVKGLPEPKPDAPAEEPTAEAPVEEPAEETAVEEAADAAEEETVDEEVKEAIEEAADEAVEEAADVAAPEVTPEAETPVDAG